MADVSYVVNLYENFGLKFEFRGYNSKLILFVEKFMEIFKEMAENGVLDDDDYLIENSIESTIKKYNNFNLEIDQRTTNNRLILLMEDEFHGDLVSQTLSDN